MINTSIDSLHIMLQVEIKKMGSYEVQHMKKIYWWWDTCRFKTYRNGPFESKEDAIEDAKRELIKYGTSKVVKFYVLPCTKYEVPECDVYRFIEDMQLTVYDECGEIADDWLCCATKEERDLLGKRIDKVFHEWLKETNNEPTFYNPTGHSEEIKIKTEV